MVVWAHYILGVNVFINISVEDPDSSEGYLCKFEWFGNRSKPAQVICKVEQKTKNLDVVLMAESEQLFRFTLDFDEPVICGIHKIPARGFAKHVLNAQNFQAGKESAVREMVSMTCAFATILSSHLLADNYPGGIQSMQVDTRVEVNPWRSSSEQQLLSIMRLVFDDESLGLHTSENDLVVYSERPFDEHLEIPRRIRLAYQEIHKDGLHANLLRFLWRGAVDRIRKLSVLIVALSFVRNDEALTKFLLCNAQNFSNILEAHSLAGFVKTWDGKSGILVPANTWFLVIALVMGGHQANVDYNSMSVFSSHGWSVFLSTLAPTDPSFADAGCIKIHPGVPSRNEIRKHAVIDGPLQGVVKGDWPIIERPRMAATLRCHTEYEYHSHLVGESFDAFLVNLRMVHTGEKNYYTTRRTGHVEPFHSNWGL